MRIREVMVKYLPSKVPLEQGSRFTKSQQVFAAFRDLYLEPVEVFRVLLLDSKNTFLDFEEIARGSLSSSVVHPREVFWSAVHHRSAAIIILHNHPSGDPDPSREDRECTKRLYNAGKILGVRLLDHIIIGSENYFSFADAGLIGGEA